MGNATQIHPTAIVHPKAKLDHGVEVGAYAIIGAHVALGANCWVDAHVQLKGRLKAGADNRFHHSCLIGGEPQDLSFQDSEHSTVSIGNNNVFHEFCQVHRSTSERGTKIGNHNFIMSLSHIAHDVHLGNHNILVQGAILGGHASIEDYTYLSAITAIHQHVRIGSCVTIGAISGIAQDIPPYALAQGERALIYGLNAIGLRRMGVAANARKALKQAYQILFRDEVSMPKGVQRVASEIAPQYASDAEATERLQHLITFIKNSKRGISSATRKSQKKSELE